MIAFDVDLFSQLGRVIGLVKQFVKTFFSDHDGFIAARAREECARAHMRMHAYACVRRHAHASAHVYAYEAGREDRGSRLGDAYWAARIAST